MASGTGEGRKTELSPLSVVGTEQSWRREREAATCRPASPEYDDEK